MAPLDLPYVHLYRSRGRCFAYYRRRGFSAPLPEATGSPEFLAAYDAAHAAAEAEASALRAAPAKATRGSLSALVALYRSAPEYRRLSDGTRAGYDRLLAPLVDRFGDLLVEEMPRAWVLGVRDELQGHPRTADYRVAVIRRLLSFAVNRGWRADNPATRIDTLHTSARHRVWTEAEVAAMTSRAAGDVRLPVLLALYTAQRLGDVLPLLWSAYDGASIRVRQSKTGAELIIAAHPALVAVLSAEPRRAAVICTTASGRGWRPDHFKHRFASVRAELGLAPDLHFHGLRHSTATRLAEAGATDAEIQSVTGHKTRAMVARYTAGARQRRLAESAIARLPGASA